MTLCYRFRDTLVTSMTIRYAFETIIRDARWRRIRVKQRHSHGSYYLLTDPQLLVLGTAKE